MTGQANDPNNTPVRIAMRGAERLSIAVEQRDWPRNPDSVQLSRHVAVLVQHIEDLRLCLRQAAHRVQLANTQGDPILSAWVDGAWRLLDA